VAVGQKSWPTGQARKTLFITVVVVQKAEPGRGRKTLFVAVEEESYGDSPFSFVGGIKQAQGDRVEIASQSQLLDNPPLGCQGILSHRDHRRFGKTLCA